MAEIKDTYTNLFHGGTLGAETTAEIAGGPELINIGRIPAPRYYIVDQSGQIRFNPESNPLREFTPEEVRPPTANVAKKKRKKKPKQVEQEFTPEIKSPKRKVHFF